MPDEPVSQMIRVPTPLVEAVRELSRLHRAGRTKAVLEGIEKLVAAIDSETDIDIDNVAVMISKLSQRLDRVEAQQSRVDSDVDSSSIAERLEKVESDIESIALTMTDLNVRVSDLEGVGDIGYAVKAISELEALDIEQTAELAQPTDSSTDIKTSLETDEAALASPPVSKPPSKAMKLNSPLTTNAPLTQSGLAQRLGVSDKAVQKQRQYGKESFSRWSRELDPDGIAWSWHGKLLKGRPLRFVPTT